MAMNFERMVGKVPKKILVKAIHRPWLNMKVFEKAPLKFVPEHYKKFYFDLHFELPPPLYYDSQDSAYAKTKELGIVKTKDIPIPVHYPDEMENMLLGGEAVIEGIKDNSKKKKGILRAFYHIPRMYHTVVYSEILDKHFEATVTSRFLNLVDEYYGFDAYIMKTSVCKLRTRLALRLKREMLLSLLYEPYNDKLKETFKKYEEYKIPFQEADWFGLTLEEAEEKQSAIFAVKKQKRIIPLKHIFRQEYIKYLKDEEKQGKAEN